MAGKRDAGEGTFWKRNGGYYGKRRIGPREAVETINASGARRSPKPRLTCGPRWTSTERTCGGWAAAPHRPPGSRRRTGPVRAVRLRSDRTVRRLRTAAALCHLRRRRPHCDPCRQRPGRPCVRCHRTLPVHARRDGEPVCSGCYEHQRAEPCIRCGTVGRRHDRGLSRRCTLVKGLETLLPPTARADLAPLRAALVASSNPEQRLTWRRRPGRRHPPARSAGHRRDPARPRRAPARLEPWITAEIARLDRPADRHLLTTWSTWQLLRRVRRPAQRERATYSRPRQVVRTAVQFLTWLHARDLTLGACTQAHLDGWLAEGSAVRQHIHGLLNWAAKHDLGPPLSVPAPPELSGDPLDDDTPAAAGRQAAARRGPPPRRPAHRLPRPLSSACRSGGWSP